MKLLICLKKTWLQLFEHYGEINIKYGCKQQWRAQADANATPVSYKYVMFYIPYCTFRRSFKEKCPLSGAKTQVKYVNPGALLLRSYRYILQCFYYIATETYCGTVQSSNIPKIPPPPQKNALKVNALSIVLEICPTPNPTLNLPDTVNKCKTDIKTYLLMQPCHNDFLICRFVLLCRNVITRDSNRSSKYISVLRELPKKLTVYENP